MLRMMCTVERAASVILTPRLVAGYLGIPYREAPTGNYRWQFCLKYNTLTNDTGEGQTETLVLFILYFGGCCLQDNESCRQAPRSFVIVNESVASSECSFEEFVRVKAALLLRCRR